jgi:hypothetical protein
LLADSGTGTQPRRQASPDRDAGCGQASAGRASAKPVPHASLGLRFRGARDQARRRKGTTGRGGSPGSSRKVRVAWLAGRYRRGAVSRLAGASHAVYDPGSKKAPCRSLTADKFEASHCFAPVAGERQLRPRSHGHGHAVHPFITLPAPYARARAAHESPGHMVVQLNVTVCDMPCSWLTRAYPPFCTGTVPSVRPAGGEQIGVFCRVA